MPVEVRQNTKYRTRDGRICQIIFISSKDPLRFFGKIEASDGSRNNTNWDAYKIDGSFHTKEEEHPLDLVERVHPIRKKKTPKIQNAKHDAVNHPKHYTSHPSGVECITITRHMTFNCGNAVKYLWRNGLKDGAPSIQDLEKAIWYINDEIKTLKEGAKND